MKLAERWLVKSISYGFISRTICSCVEDDEACIDQSCEFALLPFYRIGVATQTVTGFVDINIVVSPIQGPKSANAGRASADDSYLFPGDPVSERCHRFLYDK